MAGYHKAIAMLDDIMASMNIPQDSPPVNSDYYRSTTALALLNDVIGEIECSLAFSSSEESTNPSTQHDAPVVSSKKAKKQSKSDTKQQSCDNSKAAKSAKSLTVNSLDLRVGIIREVSVHPSADKLYCEDIDVGEEEPRKIASGLVPYYTLDEMKNRKVIVVCNLKPRNLKGFKSHGMVLCASVDGENGERKVEFVDPPSSTQAGDRIFVEEIPLVDPLSPNQCDKQKAFEFVAAELQVNDCGDVVWRDMPLVSGGHRCTAPTLRRCPVC
mmetsp:Transcript_22124/g.32219  ORF Transcript_22124/g.32219 Transcript_22124/m.32219 type:complete len:271 (-) Transcript_22124:68-880(-)